MKKALTALLFTGLLSASAAQAASFDCAKAVNADEKAICASRTLSDKDVEMATKYQFLRGLFAMGARGAMQDRQQGWLEQRRLCGSDAGCLAQSYKVRIAELDDIYQRIDKPL
ncbi:lysozyme inhibitor LprI family protein [Serratia ficaria]|uniref:Uncharacterized protein conserved in bacteria, putative lipoprotein n=1 Tax=Serratia ficaria TaxID=61651 RepID=A0A240BWK5_SERFI|nr:hypothetical protein [Serratia ficaria]REF45112.1 hypothetical protein C7332_3437 [Serratia ficaria]CAI0859781.1 Uncharacterized protein conserved in bacteria, putative lipoprotein [Serratia ficaria]CAI0911286.1 Uncharacterized protein conserved in bacteria, putative lipoprotein [Serratia ficaria]CAI0920914.1 Uncharacterized protein conserved in bacteria, putative lipoprotein [Serratia ficaria]CAI1504493.1 Uncharacterized protein conserved in bacteria, putative lipoprotein [Serratia ficaria